jgi:hypothetical protein
MADGHGLAGASPPATRESFDLRVALFFESSRMLGAPGIQRHST